MQYRFDDALEGICSSEGDDKEAHNQTGHRLVSRGTSEQRGTCVNCENTHHTQG